MVTDEEAASRIQRAFRVWRSRTASKLDAAATVSEYRLRVGCMTEYRYIVSLAHSMLVAFTYICANCGTEENRSRKET